MRIAVVFGRFQPMHNGHYSAFARIAKKCGRLLIFIGSSQYKRTHDNPLSGMERKRMLSHALPPEAAKKASIYLLRDEHDNEKWTAKVSLALGKRRGVTVFTNNSLVRRLLRPHYAVAPMESGIKLNSTRVRKEIRRGGYWKELVPRGVSEFLHRARLIEVIASI
ncbi:MAG: adenylyltransferase/cytidyltransferase family protein [Candidatus Micrarchaeota archaeon]